MYSGRRMRWPFPKIARLFALLALSILLVARWARVDASFPGQESDYGVHIAIVNRLIARPFPPPYFGIIGAHAMAAALHGLGLSIPKAMLVLYDLSILAVGASLMVVLSRASRHARLLGAVAFFLVTLPLSSSMARDGFFGQLVALAFYSVAVALILSAPGIPDRRRFVASLIMVLLGAVCYPDGALWCLPWLVLVGRRLVSGPLFWVGVALTTPVVLFLVATQIGRLKLSGGGALEWRLLIFAISVWLLTIAVHLLRDGSTSWELGPHFGSLVACWVVVAGLVCAFSLIQVGHLSYYARKNLYFLAFLAPLLAASLPVDAFSMLTAWVGLGVITVAIPRTAREDLARGYQRLARPRSPFDALDESCVGQIRAASERRHCGNPLFLPPPQRESRIEGWGQRIARVLAYNSYGARVDTDNGHVRGIEGPLGGSFPLAQLLREHPTSALQRIRPVTAPDVHCYAAGDDPGTSHGPPACDCDFEGVDRRCLVLVDLASLDATLAGSTEKPNGSAVGFQDQTTCDGLSGWAWTPDDASAHLSVEIVADGSVVASVIADEPRGDLAAAGIGNGDYSFHLPVPNQLLDGRPHSLRMRIAQSERWLESGPKLLLCPKSRPAP